MQLDKKDRLIISALQLDARQSLAALGRRIGLSQPAMSERVKKLEEGGVIVGYTAKVNLKAIGLGLQAIIRIRTTHEHIPYYVERFQSMPEVLDAVRVTGEDCFVVQCAFADPADLERVVDTLAARASVSTALVLSHPVMKAAYAEG
jgi:Lrp/AsnC family transcriptional regulator, leucine-responsive regulatory protein